MLLDLLRLISLDHDKQESYWTARPQTQTKQSHGKSRELIKMSALTLFMCV